ncbi:MAG: type VII toxin-antitoxin system HepT family RNase toxin [bacterium]|jgi:uncharacterized protein YutE (UPF0331/DUF86 family)
MYNRQFLAERTQIIRASIARLQELSSLTKEDFTGNLDNYAIAEHHLRRALQALLDLGRHIVVKNNFGNPASYREVLDLLGQHSVLDPDFARKIRAMASYRNRLVHDYAEVTNEEMINILKNELGDLTQLLNLLLAFTVNK